MINKTIIHTYNENCIYGIADFLRGSLNLFSFCKKRKYNFFINFKNTVYDSLFDTPESLSGNFIQLTLRQITLNGYCEDELEYLLKNGNLFEIDCNLINITPEIYRDEFIEFLKPSKIVLEYINSLSFPKDYLAVHFRIGDDFMEKIKLPVNETEMYSVIKNIAGDLPIIIFGDNQSIRQFFKEKYSFLTHDTKIIHTDLNFKWKNSEIDYLKTIAEFYMIGFATKIVSFNYSGFSHLSSYLYKKQFNVNYKNDHLNYLNEHVKEI